MGEPSNIDNNSHDGGNNNRRVEAEAKSSSKEQQQLKQKQKGDLPLMREDLWPLKAQIYSQLEQIKLNMRKEHQLRGDVPHENEEEGEEHSHDINRGALDI